MEKSNAVLVISSVSFSTKEVTVGTSRTVNVALETSGTLEGVVVTSLGISRKQKALGYGVSTINADQIVKTGTPNFATALYGKAAGVQIAAAPGGATSAVNITVRGLNSITGKNQALIVMDGVPIHDGEVTNNN